MHPPIRPLPHSPIHPLTHSPSAPRLYHLQCRGRGGFANRRTQILSRSPLEYETYEPEPTPIPAPNLKNPLDAMVLDALKCKPLTATEVAERIEQNPGSVRNVLTRLQKAGKIRVTAIISGRNKYKTVALNVDDLDDFDDLDDALNSTRTKSPPPLAGGGGSANPLHRLRAEGEGRGTP